MIRIAIYYLLKKKYIFKFRLKPFHKAYNKKSLINSKHLNEKDQYF